jgi:Tol biopolymer transport system component
MMSGIRLIAARGAAVALVASAIAFALFAAPASASYPGDNGRLAFGARVAGNTDIYSVLPNGHDLRRLTASPAFDACPAYSADGQRIAFCSSRSGAFEIWTMSAKGADQRQLTSLAGSATFPDFSPDGSTVAFGGHDATATSDEIYVVPASGGSPQALTTCSDIGPSCFNDYPVWSPDGTKIAFIHADRTDAGGRPVNEQVWVMEANGSNPTQLTFDAVSHDQVPDWSPDGSAIAYEDGDPGSGRIFIMNADGSGQHPVSSGPGNDFGPAWSPDGHQIAFVRDTGGAERSVLVMNPDGSGVHAVAPLGRQLVPAWQPLGGADDQ